MARLNKILLSGVAPIATPGCSHFDRILGQKLLGGELEIREATPGAIVTFDTNVAKELASLVVNIDPVQSGSGDPSPTNIRPITGWTGMTISHSGADTSNPTQVTISWQTEAGTVYGGTLDVTNGTLTVDRKQLNTRNINWSMYSGVFYTTSSSHIQTNPSVRPIAEQYITGVNADGLGTTSGWANYSIRQNTSGSSIYIKDSRFSSASDFKNNANVNFVFSLATPLTYQLTPTQISTILGTNNIWADTGDIAECKYYKK